MTTQDFKLFDSHFHIIDKRFPLEKNNGFLPDYFSCDQYRERLKNYNLSGGAIVSGSFQALDQSYLVAALKELGPGYVGVTQLPAGVSDAEILELDAAGVRGVRFNLKRGGSEGVEVLESFAHRLYDLAGWHVELYVDSRDLPELLPMLKTLPRLSIAHFGLSKDGVPNLLKLAEYGCLIKATGFYRVDFDVKPVIKELARVNPDRLVFGSDLPCTRASRPYSDDDFMLVVDALGKELAAKVFHDNAVEFYRPSSCF